MGDHAAYEIGRRLSIGWRHTHVRHATWPSLGGGPIALKTPLSDAMFDRVRSQALAEADKSLLQPIAAAPWDVLVMSTGVHAHTAYAVAGDGCTPDFTQQPWLNDLDLAGSPRPRIEDLAAGPVKRVSWLDPEFLPLAKAGFDRFYERVLAPRISSGARVIIYRQMPAEWVLTPSGLERLEIPYMAETAALSSALADHAVRHKGVSAIASPGALNFTSDDAVGGRGSLNAIDELYVYLANRIARALSDPLYDRILMHQMLEMRRERVALEWQAVGDTRQRERDLEAIVRSLIDKSAMLERDIMLLKRTLSWRVTRPLRAVRSLMRRPAPKAP
jgi:hypothetical protein